METVSGPLELMIISHPHFDHYGAADEVMEQYEVDQIITNGERRGPPRDGEPSPTWDTFEQAVEKAGLEFTTWEREQRVELTPHLSLEVLASGGDFEDTHHGVDINNDSLVLMLEYGERRILLPGDIQDDAGEMLVEWYCDDGPSACPALQADIFKVPHHGSDHFAPEFFQAVRPAYAVFGAPYENRQHFHPRLDTLDALLGLDAMIYSTNHGGGTNVEATISPDGEITWNIEEPEIFVWPENDAEVGEVCRILADQEGGVGKECEAHR